MGYSCTAHAFIGIRVTPSLLTRQVTKRGCDHHETSGKFCPECGKPTDITVEEDIPEFSRSNDMILGRYHTISRSCEAPVEFIAGIAIRHGSYSKESDMFTHISSGQIEQVKKQMEADLKPLGLWNERTFGLHVVRYESY